MIGNWIKRKINEAGYKSALNDIERFLLALRGQGDEEIGMLLAIATIIRLNLFQSGRLSESVLNFETSESEHVEAQVFVSSLVKEFQGSKQPSDAAGAMIWLHSLRSQGYPELRIKGRELWGELIRGFPYVKDALDEIANLTGKDFPEAAYNEYEYIPAGIEPRS